MSRHRPQPEPYNFGEDRLPMTREQKLRFCMTLMYRGVFHNRALLLMATDSLARLLSGNNAECNLLADLYDLCEIQGEVSSGNPPESVEIEEAIRKLDEAVARLLQVPAEVVHQNGFQSERGSNFRELVR